MVYISDQVTSGQICVLSHPISTHVKSKSDEPFWFLLSWNAGKEHNFDHYTSGIYSLGVPYDYGSLMHYGSHYFTKNEKPTIEPKKAGVGAELLIQ